jgi:hypothetical protein
MLYVTLGETRKMDLLINDRLDESAIKRAKDQGFDVTKVWYHSTGKRFDSFDLNKTADGCVWLAEDKASLISGEHAASGTDYIIPFFIHSNDLVGWDEYDKYLVEQLIEQGSNGALLDDAIMYFHPEKMRCIYDDFLDKNKNKSIIINHKLNKDVFERIESPSPEHKKIILGM